MPVPLAQHAAVAINTTSALVCGGQNSYSPFGTALSPCYAYSSTANVWTSAPSMNTARAGCNIAVDQLYKILLIGDAEVGKSCLLSRFADDSYTPSYVSTIGVDFRVRTVEVGGKNVKVQVVGWTRSVRGCRGPVTCTISLRLLFEHYYSGTQLHSFDNVTQWMQEINAYTGSTCRMLIGNKCDMEDQRAVTTNTATVK
ncbi:unnamed protein product [Sphagnum balticum]